MAKCGSTDDRHERLMHDGNLHQLRHRAVPDAAFCPSCGAPAPVAPASRKRSVPWLAALLGVVGLVAFGVLGFRLFSTSASEFVGGASSPESAVEEFTSALASEDVFAAVGFIAPDEIDGASDVLGALLSTIDGDSGGLAEGTDLKVELELADVSASMQGDDAAIVSFEVAGSIGAGETGGPVSVALPSSASFRADDLEDLYPGSGAEVEVVTVKLGGNWYVSPMLSFGHLIVENADLPSGDFDRVGAERRGGATDPEDAVEAMVAAIEDRDAEDFAESLGGGEGRFATVFVDAIDELLAEIGPDVGYAVNVRTSRGDGDDVVLDDVEVSWFDANGSGNVEVKDDCIAAEDEYGDRDRICLLDELPLTQDVDGTIEMQTVNEDDGWRVRLVPTVTDAAARLVPAFDRQTFLYAGGLEWADTATPVAVGSDTDIDLDDVWYTVHEFDAVAGQRYRVSTDRDESRLWFRNAEGNWDDTWTRTLTPEADTKVRVVTRADVDYDDCDWICLPDAGGSDTLRIRAVPVQTGPFPAVLSGELGPGDEILFDLDVAAAENIRVALNADESVSWAFVDGNYGYLAEDTYSIEPGSISIAVWNNGAASGTFELVPSQVVVGFNGSDRVTVDLGSGFAAAEVALPPGSWTIAARPLDGQDVILTVPSFDCFVDGGVGGDTERCSVSVDRSTTATVEVTGWRNSDAYGQVELVLS